MRNRDIPKDAISIMMDALCDTKAYKQILRESIRNICLFFPHHR